MSPNLVTNLSPNLVITKFVTKFGDKFVTKFVTKLHWTPICLPPLSPHQLHHHSLLHLLQGQLYGCAMSVWNTLAAVTRVLQTWLSK